MIGLFEVAFLAAPVFAENSQEPTTAFPFRNKRALTQAPFSRWSALHFCNTPPPPAAVNASDSTPGFEGPHLPNIPLPCFHLPRLLSSYDRATPRPRLSQGHRYSSFRRSGPA
ncbi:uncharacterized protein B0H64DRAFT_105897 [Chaetomium fimeti]|uniref:Secreted protein n=1 Tax=Chaetomium fimeti TaxID=1854472 RepID=A0AAE0HHF4_9PEZI|nr:hypothetical protein B0H64DRAFT_105897 [Chaetomium fimeti]